MVAPITASKKAAIGKDTYWLFPACANLAAPTALEINSASGLNITGFILAEQEGFDGSTNKVTLPRLLVETTTQQGLDQTVIDLPDFQGVFDPQASAAANDKKFWALVKDGYTGFIARRQNVVSNVSDAVVAAQFVDVAAVSTTIAVPNRSASDATGIYTFLVSMVPGAFKFNVAVA
jgi:hypothetical protein